MLLFKGGVVTLLWHECISGGRPTSGLNATVLTVVGTFTLLWAFLFQMVGSERRIDFVGLNVSNCYPNIDFAL
jgi:hypothetical protein